MVEDVECLEGPVTKSKASAARLKPCPSRSRSKSKAADRACPELVEASVRSHDQNPCRFGLPVKRRLVESGRSIAIAPRFLGSSWTAGSQRLTECWKLNM